MPADIVSARSWSVGLTYPHVLPTSPRPSRSARLPAPDWSHVATVAPGVGRHGSRGGSPSDESGFGHSSHLFARPRRTSVSGYVACRNWSRSTTSPIGNPEGMTATGSGFGGGGVAAFETSLRRTMSSNIWRTFWSRAAHPGQAGHGPSAAGVTQPCLAHGVAQSAHMSSDSSRGTARSFLRRALFTSRSPLSFGRSALSSVPRAPPPAPAIWSVAR